MIKLKALAYSYFFTIFVKAELKTPSLVKIQNDPYFTAAKSALNGAFNVARERKLAWRDPEINPRKLDMMEQCIMFNSSTAK